MLAQKSRSTWGRTTQRTVPGVLALAFLAVCLLPSAAMAKGQAALFIEDQNLTPVNGKISVPVKVSSVRDLYAYEIHVAIRPLDGAPDVVTLDGVADVILAEGGSVFPQVLTDGVAATRFGVRSGVSGTSQTVCMVTLNFPPTAVGHRYEISIAESELSDNNLKPIAHATKAGIIGPPVQLRVIYPSDAGLRFEIGQQVEIRWEAPDLPKNSRIRIELQGIGDSWVLSENERAGGGAYRWKVGQWDSRKTGQPAYPEGDHYQIRISTLDGACEDISDNEFAIGSAAPPGIPGPAKPKF